MSATGVSNGRAIAGAAGGMALYVHVPFCVRRCHYCDFSVARSDVAPTDEWLSCVEEDLRQWAEELRWSEPPRLDTIFVGGGTPSLLGEEGVERLSVLLGRTFRWDPGTLEWTLEANPGSLDADRCRAWREAGVNRLSIGVQSFDDAALRWLGRLHDARQAREAVETALAAGFENLNVDLIFGLPDDVPRDWGGDLDLTVALGVPHVSAYGLTAESRTPLGRMVELGRVRLAGEERYEREYLETFERLGAAGFGAYEVSNHARPGFECRHNWHYWIGTDYLGVGPSAHSFLSGDRVWNVYRWEAYRTAARNRAPLREGRETPGPERRFLEALWLGLRTRRGVPIAGVAGARAGRAIEEWRRAGWCEVDGGHLRLTPRGWLRMDAMVTELEGSAAVSRRQVGPGDDGAE